MSGSVLDSSTSEYGSADDRYQLTLERLLADPEATKAVARSARIITGSDGVAVLSTTPIVSEWLRAEYADVFRSAAKEVFGDDADVDFLVSTAAGSITSTEDLAVRDPSLFPAESSLDRSRGVDPQTADKGTSTVYPPSSNTPATASPARHQHQSSDDVLRPDDEQWLPQGFREDQAHVAEADEFVHSGPHDYTSPRVVRAPKWPSKTGGSTSGTMVMERSTKIRERELFFGAAGNSAVAPSRAGLSTGAPAASWCVVPRCKLRFEKCTEGFKIHCACDDDVACATLQNLCKALAGGLCSCSATLNGLTVCQCNLTCGICKCEYTSDGCCITCTSGDNSCCAILQSCCETLECCLKSGCCCYVCFNNTPCCIGT